MSDNTKPAQAPTSPKGGQGSSPGKDFLLAAAGMSWQLAAVVLVPIIGGFKLDEALNTTPVLVIIGFVVAMAGMALVVWHQLQKFMPSPITPHDKAKHL